MKQLEKFWSELQRRNVPRVATVYSISSWVIIQVASTVFPPLQVPAWVLTVLIILIIVGFPIVLILAWIFEFTPQSKADQAQAILSETSETPLYPRRRLLTSNVAIVILIAIVITQFIYFNQKKNQNTDSENSVAVMPFDNLTNDTSMESFVDGITSEITSHLSRISGLKVPSRSSVKKLKSLQASVKDISNSLTVNFILEGSVRQSRDKIRVTVELIDAKTDNHIWSEDYDYLELKDIFTVQTEVSKKVVDKLKAKLTNTEIESLGKNYTENIEAYRYYSKGRSLWDKRTRETYDSAEANFNKAIELDPQYALAYAGIADLYTYNQKGLPQVQAIPIARSYAQKALELDSNLCEALTTIGFIKSHFDYDWKEGERILKKALRCNPNYAVAHRYLGNIYALTKNKNAKIEYEKSLSLDPLSGSENWVMGRFHYHERRYQMAIDQLLKNETLNPKFPQTKTTLALSYLQTKKFDQAQVVINNISNVPPESRYLFQGLYHAYLGERIKSLQFIEKSSVEEPGMSDYRKAEIYLKLGDYEKAIEYLNKAFDVREITMIFLNVDPGFDSLRKHPKFVELLKRMNFDNL